MQSNEFNDIYAGDPQGSPEQEIAKRAQQQARRANLPKFKLNKDEDFYISREQILAVNRVYFQMLLDMRSGFSDTPEEMRSYMESVVFASYVNEIENLQRNGAIDGVHQRHIFEIKQELMQPGYVRKLFRRKRPNYALRLCIKEAELEAEIENAVYQDQIAMQEQIVFGEPDQTETDEETKTLIRVEEFFDTIVSELVPRRKRKNFINKNGDYLKELLIEFMQSQQAAFKAAQATAEKSEETPNTNDENIPSEEANEVQTAENGDDTEELEEIEYVPEADDLEELYELEEELEEIPSELDEPLADEGSDSEQAAEPEGADEESAEGEA